MPRFEMICLANSRKHNGRCVAGLVTDGSGWLRPISASADGALFSHQYRLDDGSDAQVMDVLQLELEQPRPEHHQPENWVIGRGRWQLIKRHASVHEYRDLLRPFVVHGPDLLGNSSDRVDYNLLLTQPAAASLALVALKHAELLVTTSVRGKRQIRATFQLAGASYNLGVTDPQWEQQFESAPTERVHHLENVLMTVSLGEPFNGFCYKLVAAIIPF